jgi:CYTH domain-containing protein
MSDAIEIERKWVLQALPELTDFTDSAVEVVQGYLVDNPGELRVRQLGTCYFMTVKGDGDLSRQEWEEEIPEWVFHQLLPSCRGIVTKTRYRIQPEAPCMELDIYHDKLGGLVVVETEWVTNDDTNTVEEQAKAFELPAWLGLAQDVTQDKQFKNKALAQASDIPKVDWS